MRKALAVASALLGVVALTGCGSEEPERPCLKHETTTVLMPISTGKVTSLVPITQTRCVRYAPEEVTR